MNNQSSFSLLLTIAFLFFFGTFVACAPTQEATEPTQETQQHEQIQENPPTDAQEQQTPEKRQVPEEQQASEKQQVEPEVTKEDKPEPELQPEPVRETLPEKQPDTDPQPAYGKISGDCGILDDKEWKSTKSFFFRNSIDFGQIGFAKDKLSQEGKKVFDAGNLGGQSLHSEVFAFEVLHWCEKAKLLKTEAKITYKNKSGKKTDLLLSIDNRKIGVSVTRAFQFPAGQPYTEKNATSLLEKKLGDMTKSMDNAAASDKWSRSILLVVAYNKQHADMVEKVYKKLASTVSKNNIVIVTTTDGKDGFIYGQ